MALYKKSLWRECAFDAVCLTAGRLEGKWGDDWMEASSGRLNVLACIELAGPAPHEAVHWLAWALLPISGSSVSFHTMRWILAATPWLLCSGWDLSASLQETMDPETGF